MNEALTLKELKERLHPKRFTEMSSKMAFIVGAILAEDWASGPHGEKSPGTHFHITSDGYVISGNMFIGSVEEFENNLERLEQAAKLNEEQRKMFALLKDSCITDYRRPGIMNMRDFTS
jgi:hypothetical protein